MRSSPCSWPRVFALVAALTLPACGASVGTAPADAGVTDAVAPTDALGPGDARVSVHVTPATGQPCIALPQTRAGEGGSVEPRDAACVTETIATDGCAVTRTTRTLDAQGRVATERFEILDIERFRQPTYARITNTWTVYERDAAGRVVRESVDSDIDGTLDVVTQSTYDAAGQLRVREERNQSYAAEGLDESVSRTEYDAAGRETFVENRSGMFSDAQRTTYDAAGRELGREERQNGVVVARTTWERRADGELVHRTRARPSGETLDETLWTYDLPGGQREREERDLFASGRAARVRATRYDAAGREVHAREDYPRDGVDDEVHAVDYDAAGHRVREFRQVLGYPASETVWTYDPAGRVRTSSARAGERAVDVSYVYAPDGSATSTEVERAGAVAVGTTTRSFDAAGRELERALDRHSDGTVDERERHGFDAAGHELYAEQDLDADGRADTTQRWSYDAEGRLFSREIDSNGDGAPEFRETWTFDAGGNLLEHQDGASLGRPVLTRNVYACYGR